jgi:succinoglycan biosynthesis protein ExoO
MNSLVSVIIPTYNVEPYIEKAVQSVLTQTYQNFEIILVDDCSTDLTVKKIKEFTDQRIRLELNPQNNGPSLSRNRAIELSKGKWIAILDGDDWWEASRLETMVKIGETCNCEIVCDNFHYIVNEAEKPWDTYFTEKHLPIKKLTACTVTDLIKYDFGPLKPLFRKEFLSAKALKYNQEVTYGEDFLLLFESMLHGANMLVTPEALYFRRARDTSLTAQRINSTENLIELTAKLLLEIKSGKYPERDNNSLIEALEKRLSQQRNALIYHGLIVPFKNRQYVFGSVNLLKNLIIHPSTFLIIAGRIPEIIDYRILRHLR